MYNSSKHEIQRGIEEKEILMPAMKGATPHYWVYTSMYTLIIYYWVQYMYTPTTAHIIKNKERGLAALLGMYTVTKLLSTLYQHHIL